MGSVARKEGRAVIFDLDGVLVDSSRFHFRAWQRWAEEARVGHRVTEAWFRETFGMRNEEIFATLFARALAREEIESYSQRKEEIFRERARGRIQPLPGVRGLVGSIDRRGFKMAVGTSTPRRNLELILKETGLSAYFPVRVTGEDVERGKPDPAVFLVAAERLRIDPRRCVVIEDAESGIEAARQAGMASIAVSADPGPGPRRANLVVGGPREIRVDDIERLTGAT